MKTVTDRVSNPFDLHVPDRYAGDSEPRAVYGYGDVNADFHVIGDRPSVHGGETTGIPFTDTPGGERLQRVLEAVGLLDGPLDDTLVDTLDETLEDTFDDTHEETLDRSSHAPTNLYLSYLFPGRRPTTPDDDAYADLERYFDAELRAINAHVLLPVGATAIDHVLEEYTTHRRRYPRELDDRAMHATAIRGRGFLVVPIREPADWTSADERALEERLREILGRDYRQTKGVATLVG